MENSSVRNKVIKSSIKLVVPDPIMNLIYFGNVLKLTPLN
jgi:hypothetical protein